MLKTWVKLKNDTLPNSIEAEQAVLGSLLLIDKNYWDDVVQLIDSTDFYNNHHRIIFEEMANLIKINQPIDLITLTERLENKGALENVGGFSYIAELAKHTPIATNVIAYSNIVKACSIKRELHALCAELTSRVIGQSTPQDLVEFTERKLFQIAQRNDHSHQNELSVSALLDTTLTQLEKRYASGDTDFISGAPCGINEIDKITCGFQPGDLIIVAARPSMGKTAFAITSLIHSLDSRDAPAFFYSIEMPKEQIMERMLSSMARVSLHGLRSGNLSDDDWQKISIAIATLTTYENKLIINDDANLTPTLLRSHIRRHIRKYGKPSLIIIDYLQLMKITQKTENRNNEISEISRNLKAMAKEFLVPIIALSQLNRGVEQRGDKRPINGDLRDSGSIEQDADLIIHLYRDEVYNENSSDRGIAELIIGKHRNGPIGRVRAGFIGEHVRFCSLNQMERRH